MRTVSEAKKSGVFAPYEVLIDDTVRFDPTRPREEVLRVIPDGTANPNKRRLTLTIEAEGTFDDQLQPYVDRVLKVWMARGGGLDGLVETVNSGYDCITTVRLDVRHEFVRVHDLTDDQFAALPESEKKKLSGDYL